MDGRQQDLGSYECFWFPNLVKNMILQLSVRVVVKNKIKLKKIVRKEEGNKGVLTRGTQLEEYVKDWHWTGMVCH